MNIKKSFFGVFGLGVMGKSISLNIAEKGFSLSVYNRLEEGESDIVKNFLNANRSFNNLKGFSDISDFIDSLKKPRNILLMIKAGATVDLVLEKLLPFLSEGDIIIDGGNSHYLHTKRRFDLLKNNGINFIGAGISGGEEGARKGPSIMPGGTKESYDAVANILESISAKDDHGEACCNYIGPEGSGHFIKMVHNGIEYVEMQLLAELFALMSKFMDYDEIANVFEQWNKGGLSSYLLDITITILRKKEGDQHLLRLILDKAGNKGTGSWSSKSAFDLGIPNTMMSSAVFARYISSFKDSRIELSKIRKHDNSAVENLDLKILKNAYQFARIINHHQGFELMKKASDTYNWNLSFSEIARIWTNGCIIKSDLMSTLKSVFENNAKILKVKSFQEILIANEKYLSQILRYGIDLRVSLHAFGAAYNYWVDMTTENLPANLIQAQRDFFGSHTYQRTDGNLDNFYHTNWN